MTTNQTKKLTNATVETYHAAPGEQPDLTWQVRATHASMGAVQLCYTSKTEADIAAKFINTFGICPPRPDEMERLAQLESRPVLTACVDCGENTPESGLVCDGCREDAQGD